MLAMIVLGVGVSALLVSTSRCLAVIRRERHYNRARNLIHQVDLEHPLDREDIDDTDLSGSFRDPDGWRWERAIEELDEELLPGLFLVKTRVFWSDAGDESYEERVEYLYAPQSAEDI